MNTILGGLMGILGLRSGQPSIFIASQTPLPPMYVTRLQYREIQRRGMLGRRTALRIPGRVVTGSLLYERGAHMRMRLYEAGLLFIQVPDLLYGNATRQSYPLI
jgi:hypothetical protein